MIHTRTDAPGSESVNIMRPTMQWSGTAWFDRRRRRVLPRSGGVHLLILVLVASALAGCDLKDRRDAPADRRHARGGDAADALDGSDTMQSAESDAGSGRTTAAVTGPIGVFFSNTYAGDPEVGESDIANIDRRCAAFIATARRTLDCAFFELESDRIAAALIAARRRGVRVRVVAETDYRDNGPMQAIMAAGIVVRFDGRAALMHNKFIVVDGAAVWTGSYNVTNNCAFRNNNNGLIIRSAELAENYTAELSEMFDDGMFGPRSPAATPHSLVKLPDGTDIYNYFSPEDDVPPKIVRFLRAAKKSVHFMAFSFTDSAVAEAMLEDARRGVSVEGVVETRGASGRGAQAPRLRAGGVPTLLDGNRYVMHHKVIVIDGLWTIIGSYNFTGSAAESNDENLLVIKSSAVARAFEGEYDRIKRMARRANPS